MVDKLGYRENGSIIAKRADGRYLLVRKPRVHNAWQFPQGGVDPGEDIRSAALREFREEIGTDKIKIIGEERDTYRYDWPPEKAETKGYRGQNVHLFLAEFTGTDSDIKLQLEELAEYRWVTADELPDLIEDSNYLIKIQEILKQDEKN